MKDLPLVSICIPTYQAATFLRPCLLSALGQTYSHTEILVCDDGSKDDTINIIREFQLQYPQIRLVQNSTNVGMVNNWNQCVELAKGEWIKFLFQDDLLEPNAVEVMLAACQQQRTQVALCARDFLIHDDALPHIQSYFSQVPRSEDVFNRSPFVSPSQLADAIRGHLLENFMGEPTCYLFQKDLFKASGPFNVHLKQVVDYEFITRLALVKGLAFVPEILAHFRVHGKSESSANNQRDKAAQLRNLAAETGDAILLLNLYKQHPGFTRIREVTGADVLENYMRQLYYSACKHKGEKLVNEALKPIRTAYPEIGALKYSFLNYVVYRRRMKKWLRQLKEQKQ